MKWLAIEPAVAVMLCLVIGAGAGLNPQKVRHADKITVTWRGKPVFIRPAPEGSSTPH